MAEPALISSYPEDGAVNQPTNLKVVIEFNTPLYEPSVNEGTVFLTNKDTDEPLEIRVSVESNVVTIFPGRALEDYTTFLVQLAGADFEDAELLGTIMSESGEELQESISFAFQTAVPFTGETTRDDGNVVRPIIDPSGIMGYETYPDFAFAEAAPPDGTLYIDPDYLRTNGFVLEFSETVDPESLNGNIEIEQRPLADGRYSVVNADDMDGICDMASPSGIYSYHPERQDNFSNPVFTAEASGDYVTITFDNPEDIRWNSQLRVTLGAGLKSSASVGQVPLASSQTLLYSTGMFPAWGSIERVRHDLATLNSEFSDFEIIRMIMKMSIWAWQLACCDWNVFDPPFAVVEFVHMKTVYNLLTGPKANAVIGRETRKSLGDFAVSFGDASSIWKDKIADLKKLVDEWERFLIGFCGSAKGGGQIAIGVKGISNVYSDPNRYRTRHWTQYQIPQQRHANTEIDRAWKVPRVNDSFS